MNREIKFRAWDKVNNRMFDGWVLDGSMTKDGSWDGGYFGELEFPVFDTPEGLPREGWDFKKPEEVELMQYTGLKDKNGVEIYEGDIVNGTGGINHQGIWEWDFTGVMKWQGYGFDLVYCDKGREIGCGLGFNDSFDNGLEVIGNICENPELLEINNVES